MASITAENRKKKGKEDEKNDLETEKIRLLDEINDIQTVTNPAIDAEIPILKGSTDILEKTDFIILEIPLFGQYNEGVPDFACHINFMNSIGFIIYDIIDNHYINNFNMQVDAIFINRNHPFNKVVNEIL